MKQLFNFEQIKKSPLFNKTVADFLGTKDLEVVERPACYFVRLKRENNRLIKRIIVLRPHGYTADEIDLLSPHPEARSAKVKIMGKINPEKKGYKPLIDELQFDYSYSRHVPTEKTSAYARFSKEYCGTKIKSWRNWFYVVKRDGQGDFHNLVNLSDEWVVLLLEKELLDQKIININPYLKKLHGEDGGALRKIVGKIHESGDSIFEDKKYVANVLKFPSDVLVPIFIQMLNVQETGKHENCTFFAFLLKLARKDPDLVLKEVKKAIAAESAPHYYLEDLQNKLSLAS